MENKNRSIIGLVILGFIVLFFFPEPETNFFAYAGTGLLFLGLLVWLAGREKKK